MRRLGRWRPRRNWTGWELRQCLGQAGVDAFGVGQHFGVPEAEDAGALAFDFGSSGGVCGLRVLAAVEFYDQSGAVAGEIGYGVG